MPDCVQIEGLCHGYRGRPVLEDVALEVPEGAVVGLLGPNGAGKTTLMSLVAGLMPPQRGHLAVLGRRGVWRDAGLRLNIGFLQEKPRIWPEMTARAYLRFFAGLYRVPDAGRRVAEVLARLGLEEAADRPLGGFSRGMQQRACLARVLLHRPRLVLLDEPTLGLDPAAVAAMREVLGEMRADGATLILSSHQLDEIARLCDRVVFLRAGRVVAQGAPGSFAGGPAGGTLEVELAEPVAAVLAVLRRHPDFAGPARGDAHRALFRRTDAGGAGLPGALRTQRAELSRWLAANGLTVLAVAGGGTLEEAFLALADAEPATTQKDAA